MQTTIQTILAAKRKSMLRSKPVFHFHAPATEMELFMVARKLNCKMTVGLSRWLRTAGYGDINGALMFRENYFSLLTSGALSGCVTFARDEIGNAYAFSQQNGNIFFIDRRGNLYARMADDFPAFMRELAQRDYDLTRWRESLIVTYDPIN
jgi:hypothetical protein